MRVDVVRDQPRKWIGGQEKGVKYCGTSQLETRPDTKGFTGYLKKPLDSITSPVISYIIIHNGFYASIPGLGGNPTSPGFDPSLVVCRLLVAHCPVFERVSSSYMAL